MLSDVLEDAKAIILECLDDCDQEETYSDSLIKEASNLVDDLDSLILEVRQWEQTITNSKYENLQD